MLGPDHDRNLVERAVILALAFRAGLASNGNIFTVEPATLRDDHRGGFDLILRRNRHKLYVDVTSSRRFKGKKIDRAVEKAKNGGHWVFILRADWTSAAFDVCLDPCFDAAFEHAVVDGRPITIKEICPKHGNECGLAKRLFRFGKEINNALAFASTSARKFAMEVSEEPLFK